MNIYSAKSMRRDALLPSRPLPSLVAWVLLMSCALSARAADTYVLLSQQLTIPSLAIGSASYANVVVTVENVVSGPGGAAPLGDVDIYDPATKLLTVQAVVVGNTTYYNAVVTVGRLLSIGAVTGADSYDGAYLTLASVSAGGATYANVILAVSPTRVVSVGSGLPGSGRDQYDAATGELTIAAVRAGNAVYTNVVIRASLADIQAVGPTVSIAQLQNDIFTPYCADCHYGSGSRLPGSMDLSSASASAASLVGVASEEYPKVLRVNPRNPLASYLVWEVKGSPGIQGVQMPGDGPPYLSQAQIEEINSWILGL